MLLVLQSNWFTFGKIGQFIHLSYWGYRIWKSLTINHNKEAVLATALEPFRYVSEGIGDAYAIWCNINTQFDGL